MRHADLGRVRRKHADGKELVQVQRVLILGSPGSGKSTLARNLGAVTSLPVIHLDTIYWGARWTEPDPDVFRAAVAALVDGPRWIIDGDYGSTLDLRLPRADMIVILNISRYRCLWRILKRRFSYARRPRPDLAPGCPERLDFDFWRYVWRYPADKVPQRRRALAQYAATVPTLTVTSRHDVAALLAYASAMKGGN